jgi:hypothetical protein
MGKPKKPRMHFIDRRDFLQTSTGIVEGTLLLKLGDLLGRLAQAQNAILGGEPMGDPSIAVIA